MEWINPAHGKQRTDLDEILKTNMLLLTLDSIGTDTSVYSGTLYNSVEDKDFYLITTDGKLFDGSVSCNKTRQKDRVTNRMIRINTVLGDAGEVVAFQFVVLFKDGTMIDARGDYARTSLKIIRRNKLTDRGAIR